MGLEELKLAYERAINERNKAYSKLIKIRNEITHEEFESLLIQRGNLSMIEHRTLGKFIIDDNIKEVSDLMYSYITHSDTEKINPTIGMILIGKFGCGKSILMSAFCKVLSDLGISEDKIEEVHSMALSEMIKRDGLLPWAKKPLLIQDMGMEEPIVNSYGNKFNPIGNLLAIRNEYGAFTFGTSNMKFQRLRLHLDSIIVETDSELKKYEDKSTYVGSRLKEHVNFILLKGESRRKDFRKPETI